MGQLIPPKFAFIKMSYLRTKALRKHSSAVTISMSRLPFIMPHPAAPLWVGAQSFSTLHMCLYFLSNSLQVATLPHFQELVSEDRSYDCSIAWHRHDVDVPTKSSPVILDQYTKFQSAVHYFLLMIPGIKA